MITADQVREWLCDAGYDVTWLGIDLLSVVLADRINAALALAVAGAYRTAIDQVSTIVAHAKEHDTRDVEEVILDIQEALLELAPQDAQAALEADRDRTWQQFIEAMAKHLCVYCACGAEGFVELHDNKYHTKKGVDPGWENERCRASEFRAQANTVKRPEVK